MIDKRKRHRTQAGFEINIDLGGELMPVRMINISLNGILCKSSGGHFRPDVACRVVITLDSGTSLSIMGKIVRCSPEQTAIAFTSMDEVSFTHLKNIVALNTGDADIIEKELAEPGFAAVSSILLSP